MDILIIGASGRENALIEKISESELCDKIYCAPGNDGLPAGAERVAIRPEETEALCDFAVAHRIGLTVVSAASPLALGITERFESEGLKVFGPSADAIRFTRDDDKVNYFLAKYIPASVHEDAVKNDNIGIQCICDGKHIFPLITYKLYRTLYDNDEGELTAGMGAYSPVELLTTKVIADITAKIIEPLETGFKAEGLLYKGILNIKLTVDDGEFFVCGFGTYMGEPETELLTLRIKTDMMKLILSATDSAVSPDEIELDSAAAVCCVLASGGYPGEYRTGFEISMPPEEEGVRIFIGAAEKKDGVFYTAGGRVLYVCAKAHSIGDARERIYDTVQKIGFSGMYYRSDIARKVL